MRNDPQNGRNAVKWWELVVEVPPDDAEGLAGELVPFAYGGVAVEPAIRSESGSEEFELAPGLPALVKAYLPVDGDFPVKREAMVRRVAALAPRATSHERQLEESDWGHAWRRHVRAVRIGDRLLVRPPWSRAKASKGAVVVELEPGMAFGTGDHPTTKACLNGLVQILKPGGRVLDLGTGSGILAIAAIKLGASAALALDTDHVATEAARENAAHNEVEDRVTVVMGSVTALEARGWDPDLLLANLTSRLHQELAAAIVAAIPAGGMLLGAGIGEAGLTGVLRAYRAAGARGIRVGRRGAWRTIRWTKPGLLVLPVRHARSAVEG